MANIERSTGNVSSTKVVYEYDNAATAPDGRFDFSDPHLITMLQLIDSEGGHHPLVTSAGPVRTVRIEETNGRRQIVLVN